MSTRSGLLLGALLAGLSWGCGKSQETGKKKAPETASKAREPASPYRHKVPPCPAEDKNKVVAEVNGIKIMKCEVYDRINKLSPYIRRRYTNVKAKKDFVMRLVRFELLAQEAKRQGLDKDPDVRRSMKEMMVQKLRRKLFQNKFKPGDITEEELRKYYEAHKSDYNKPEMVRVSHILVKTKAEAEKLLAEAKKLDVRGFRQLARQKSLDESTKLQGGDLRYFAKDDTSIPKPIVEAAFQLKKRGDVAGPIKTDKGWHVIMLVGRRRPIKRTFSQVRALLRNRLLREKRLEAEKKFVEELKASTKPFEVHEDKLNLVKVCKTKQGESAHTHRPLRIRVGRK